MKQLSPGSDLVDPKILRGPSIGHNVLPDIPNIECPIFKLKMKLRLSSKKTIRWLYSIAVAASCTGDQYNGALILISPH